MDLIRQGYGRNVMLEAVGLPANTYRYHVNHEPHVTRPDLDGLVVRIFERSPNGCGYRKVHMALVNEFRVTVSAKSVLKVMNRLGLRCGIRRPNPHKRYCSYERDGNPPAPDRIRRNFRAGRPFEKIGTDVTEFQLRNLGVKVYLAILYDMCSKEIVSWDASTSPNLEQQMRLLERFERVLPDGAMPIIHSDMGWQYRNPWWKERVDAGLGVRSMSRKGNCLDNAATEQVFGHLKDEFYKGRRFDSLGQFMTGLASYIDYWNTQRRQKAIGGHTPVEHRMSLST